MSLFPNNNNMNIPPPPGTGLTPTTNSSPQTGVLPPSITIPLSEPDTNATIVNTSPTPSIQSRPSTSTGTTPSISPLVPSSQRGTSSAAVQANVAFALGIVGFLLLVAGVAFYIWRRNQKKQASPEFPVLPFSAEALSPQNGKNPSLPLPGSMRSKKHEQLESVIAAVDHTSDGTPQRHLSSSTLHSQHQLQTPLIITLPPSTHQLYTVYHGHDPGRPDELLLRKSDVVSVKSTFQDGWGYGTNLTLSTMGFFPLMCLISDEDYADLMYSAQEETDIHVEEDDERGRHGRMGWYSSASKSRSRSRGRGHSRSRSRNRIAALSRRRRASPPPRIIPLRRGSDS